MKLVESVGYSREEAFMASNVDADFSMFKNATQAWKKAGAPLGKDLSKFLESYTQKQKLVGAYVVVDGSVADTRERPYTAINETTDGKRKFKRYYSVVEADLKVTAHQDGEKTTHSVKVISTGATFGKAEKKDDAMKLMKELIAKTKKNFVVKIVEEVVEGKEFAGYGIYTPSKAAKPGKFVFGINE